MEQRAFPTKDGTIAYWVGESAESRPWLVMLPGLTADHHLFDPQIEHFEGHYNLLTWDAPHHAQSRPFTGDLALESCARYLNAIFKAEGISKPILIGQSFGSYIAQMYLQLFPGTVAGLVSIDSAPLKRSYYRSWEIWLLEHTYWMYRCIPWRVLVPWGANGCSTTEHGRAYMRRILADYQPKEYCRLADMGFRALGLAAKADLPYEIDCPVLLICGTKDAAGAAKRYNVTWNEREGFPLEWIEGAGHNSNYDDPRAVNTHLDRFIQNCR